jgi:hypothetical protein
MPQNPAETRSAEKPTDVGISHSKSAGIVDRRISVAPMMDWTDCAKTFFSIKCLRPVENACLLYVSSILRNGNLLMLSAT